MSTALGYGVQVAGPSLAAGIGLVQISLMLRGGRLYKMVVSHWEGLLQLAVIKMAGLLLVPLQKAIKMALLLLVNYPAQLVNSLTVR